LFEINLKHNVKCSPLAKLSYRICRLNLSLEREIKSKKNIAIYDRGVINTIFDCIQDEIDPNLILPYYEEIFKTYEDLGILIIYLKPPFEIIKKRLAKRRFKPEKELDDIYLENYYNNSYEIFNQFEFTNNRIVLDSHQYSTNELVDKIVSIH
jgi:deoxyadenosine/deoxycytidine kinase